MTTAAATGRRRRIGAWIAIGAVLVGAGIVGTALSGAGRWAERDALDPDSHGPTGTRAIVQLLRAQGVDVVVARDRAAADAALQRSAATLALPDAPALSDDALSALADAAADIVLLDPRARTLDLFLPGAEAAGYGDGRPVEPDCDLPEATRAGTVVAGSLFHAPSGGEVVACYTQGEASALLVAEQDGGRTAVVDGLSLLTNQHLADDGNAALALGLLGRHDTVVWYVPSLADSDLAGGDPSLGELTPPWVSPAIVLLIAAALAAAVWRGRRFGPLVAERLPVTVRASETTEGRARLYARSRDAVHAADQLRIGTAGRLSALLGLGRSASIEEIADAAADRTGADHGRVRGILIHDLPHGDAQLVALHDALRALESAVRAAVLPPNRDRP